jgi:hypothetical protein
MKIFLLLFFLCFSAKVYSQHNKEKYLGIIGEISFSKKFNAVRPNISYNINKFQFILGPVISRKVGVYSPYPGVTTTESYLGITGIALGAKYYFKNIKAVKMYFFMDNIFLNYHTYERLEYIYNSTNIGLIDDPMCGSKLLLIQPIIGIGDEVIIRKYLKFSLDFGVGFSNRRYKYDDFYDNYYYPKTLFNYTAQLRANLCFIIRNF